MSLDNAAGMHTVSSKSTSRVRSSDPSHSQQGRKQKVAFQAGLEPKVFKSRDANAASTAAHLYRSSVE